MGGGRSLLRTDLDFPAPFSPLHSAWIFWKKILAKHSENRLVGQNSTKAAKEFLHLGIYSNRFALYVMAATLFLYSFRRTFVKNGIPEVIYEAVCDSAYCDYPLRDTDAHNSLAAVPIHQVLLVLQRQTGRSKCYIAHFRRVAVGCTCVWAKMSSNTDTEWICTKWLNSSVSPDVKL